MENFRPMRRADRALSRQECLSILQEHCWGILSLIGDGGYPYGVPVNYGFSQGKIYVHGSAGSSHKTDAIRENSRVCFTVVSRHILMEEELTASYESVIVFGTANVLTEPGEKRAAVQRMMSALAPLSQEVPVVPCDAFGDMVMIEIQPEHITGKGN